MVVAVQQRQLVDQDGPQGKALGIAEAFGADGAVDAFDVLVEVLHRKRAQFVEDTTDLDATVGVRIRPAPRVDEDLVLLVWPFEYDRYRLK